jgi:hypothetical protein
MNRKLIVDTNELARFLVRAKQNSWAGERGKVEEPQRPGFKEFVFKDGDWEYRDSYTAFFCAPGQEIARLKDQPVWAMSYDGEMEERYWGDIPFARKTFDFLKQALQEVNKSMPFRGPRKWTTGQYRGWVYECEVQGDIKRFTGVEKIVHFGREAFRQNFIGGLIVSKQGIEVR